MIARKYAHIWYYSMRDQLRYLTSFAARNIFFVVILFIFYSLWRVIYADHGVIAGLTMTQTLWYLTFTETIELCKVRLHTEVQQEVREGSIAYGLVRPYSYVLFKVSRAMGESVLKIVPIMVIGFVVATLFTGLLPGYLRALPFGLVLIIGGLILNSLWLLLFGLLAFWVEEVSPFYWIFQKLVFVLGGMFFPIDFFPPWMQTVSRRLPFAFSAYWPAKTMVSFDPRTFWLALRGQVFYIACLGLLAMLVFRLAVRRVHAHGG